jgi:chemotaxis protein methyltransferase CheR
MEGWPRVRLAPQPPPDELLSDPAYSSLKEYVIESTGLSYYGDKDADFARRIFRRLSDFGFQNCGSYLEVLRDPIQGGSEMNALIEEITIGETYFFRHREHFDALRDLVLPDLIARNTANRRLRIWCAGCADGAEPYSLSILLRRELSHLLLGWEVSILGTDINRQFLAAAREGRFEQWSLRSTPESLRHACFEEKGKAWTISPEYKAGVSFQLHNLVKDAFPPQMNNPSAFDLIICRNVMIYFGPMLMRSIVRQFYECLAPGAWLLVGPSEPNMTCFTSFQPVNAPGVTFYQRPVRSAPEFVAAVALPNQPLPMITSPLVAPSPVMQLSESVEMPAIDLTTEAPVPTLADLRQSADRGDWENAARYGKELLRLDNLNALAHFHYALVLEQMGNYAESERSLRRAIYLDRQGVLAHYHLGLFLQSRGNPREAERCFNNVLTLLSTLSDNEVLTNADGITVFELRKMAQTQIENLRVRV